MKFSQYLSEYRPRIESTIGSYFLARAEDSGMPLIGELYRMLAGYCLRPGKRVRPLLVIAAYRGYAPDADVSDGVISCATAVELFHSFLLIHDDIIDRALTRRGDAAMHVALSPFLEQHNFRKEIASDIAIVLGDQLSFIAIDLIANANISDSAKCAFLKIFGRTFEITGWGQILDIAYSRPKELPSGSTVPQKIAEYKTAYYTIYNPLRMGAALAGKNSPEVESALQNVGVPLGIAFQLKDDLLGVFGSEGTTGKSNDSDLTEGKYTSLIQLANEHLESVDRERLIKLFHQCDDLNVLTIAPEIRMLIKKSGSDKMVESRINELIIQARENLIVPEIPEEIRVFLSEVADMISSKV